MRGLFLGRVAQAVHADDILIGRTVELGDNTLWPSVGTGDSARISFLVRTQKLTWECSPVILIFVRLK